MQLMAVVDGFYLLERVWKTPLVFIGMELMRGVEVENEVSPSGSFTLNSSKRICSACSV